MDEIIFVTKTRNFIPLIQKIVSLENLSGSGSLINSDEIKIFENFVNDKIKLLERERELDKSVKFVYRSR